MNHPAPDSRRSADDRAALISALVDGEAQALQPGCELWRDDAQARRTWHTYHLIGDVLRSDDLAAAPARDAAFLAALRTRLAQEPAVLAPQPAKAPARRVAWLVPAAAAAGFVAVAGVLVVTRLAAPADEAPVLAVGGSAGGGLTLTTNGARPVQPLVIEGRLIRDERLDAYLRAHREASGGFAVAVPGGTPRNIETLAPAMPVPNAVSR
jgi:sigma-E factor negative regulatory protein RseA